MTKKPLISQAQLEEITDALIIKAKELGLDPYLYYINQLIEKQPLIQNLPPEEKRLTEIHHINPKHNDGLDEPGNLVRVTIDDHLTAHWLRWKTYGQRGDKIAVLRRLGQTLEARAEHLKALVEMQQRNRELKLGRFNSEYQQQRGKEGGAKGGSANTEAQRKARQKVGQTYGVIVGESNQGEELKAFLPHFSLWGFSEKAYYNPLIPVPERKDEIFFLIEPKRSFATIARVLRRCVPEMIARDGTLVPTIKHNTSLQGLLGRKKSVYGWRLVGKLTRSEVLKGIEEFERSMPNVTLIMEEDIDLLHDDLD